MKLLIVRHADPDYERDSLTPAGEKEAEALAEYLKNVPIDYAYLSPLGRAQKTASYTLQAKHMTGETCPWLTEFTYLVKHPDTQKDVLIWDFLPSVYRRYPAMFDKDQWKEVDFIKNSIVSKEYDNVTNSLDALLKRHGYVRDGLLYRAEKSNTDTIAFFCHFGLESMLLSHLLNIAPASLSHNFCALPSAITEVVTEEREEGTVQFRTLCFGGTPHLALKGLQPSFSARFCETFDSPDRH